MARIYTGHTTTKANADLDGILARIEALLTDSGYAGDGSDFVGFARAIPTTLKVLQNLAIGADINPELTLYVKRASTASGSNYGIRLDHDVGGTGSSAGIDVRMTTSGSESRDHIVPLQVRTIHSGTGAMTNIFGLTVGDTCSAGAGTVTNYYGVDIQQVAGTGEITNVYGVRVRDLGTRGTSKTYAIYTEGSTPSHFGGTIDTDANVVVDGKVAIGGTVFDSMALRIVHAALSGATTQYGGYIAPVFASGATGGGIALYAKASTAAAAFTQAIAAALYAAAPSKGAGSTITTAYGLFVEAITQGTTNYAIYTQTGTVRFGDVVQFAGTNTTGAGSAALGANCPAVTASAPFTWIQAKSADGSTVFIPAWK